MTGIVLMAILLPAGIILTFIAVSRWGDTRRFKMGGAVAFGLVAIWNLGSVIVRATRGDFGMLFFIELVLMAGFAFQALWIWRVNLEQEER